MRKFFFSEQKAQKKSRGNVNKKQSIFRLNIRLFCVCQLSSNQSITINYKLYLLLLLLFVFQQRD